MSYERGRVCDECGNPSPSAVVCGGCEQAIKSFELGARSRDEEVGQLQVVCALLLAARRYEFNVDESHGGGYVAYLGEPAVDSPLRGWGDTPLEAVRALCETAGLTKRIAALEQVASPP